MIYEKSSMHKLPGDVLHTTLNYFDLSVLITVLNNIIISIPMFVEVDLGKLYVSTFAITFMF